MTLTETATITKRFLRVFLIFGSAFIVLWIAFLIIYNNFIIPYQRSQERAEKRFGALPQPVYPPSVISSASLTYSLDTRSGGLPPTPKLINVYFIPPSETTLLSPDRARQLAAALGFNEGPEILSPTQYRFKDSTGGMMQIDLSTSNFSFRRIPTNPPDAAQDETLPDEQRATVTFRNFLDKKGLIKGGLEQGTSNIIYESGDNQNSNTATVSLWPNLVDQYPVVTGNPKIGLINATMTKYQDETLRFPAMSYTYWFVDRKTFSTYELKSANQAFEELKRGSGIVVRNGTSDNKASITNVYLAYYMAESYNSFLHPVLVFEGPQFTAYIPALTPDSYSK